MHGSEKTLKLGWKNIMGNRKRHTPMENSFKMHWICLFGANYEILQCIIEENFSHTEQGPNRTKKTTLLQNFKLYINNKCFSNKSPNFVVIPELLAHLNRGLNLGLYIKNPKSLGIVFSCGDREDYQSRTGLELGPRSRA